MEATGSPCQNVHLCITALSWADLPLHKHGASAAKTQQSGLFCFASGTEGTWSSTYCCPDTLGNLTEHHSDSWATSKGIRICWSIITQNTGSAHKDYKSTCQHLQMIKWLSCKLNLLWLCKVIVTWAFKLVYFKYGCFSASKDPSFWWLIYSQLPHYSDRSLLQKTSEVGKESASVLQDVNLVLSSLLMGTLENSPWNTTLCTYIYIWHFSRMLTWCLPACVQDWCPSEVAMAGTVWKLHYRECSLCSSPPYINRDMRGLISSEQAMKINPAMTERCSDI